VQEREQKEKKYELKFLKSLTTFEELNKSRERKIFEKKQKDELRFFNTKNNQSKDKQFCKRENDQILKTRVEKIRDQDELE
jgi:hypothetical protein